MQEKENNVEKIVTENSTSQVDKIDDKEEKKDLKSDLDVLYEDNHIIVVVKPQNIPSQADITGDEDMLSKVKNYIKE